MTIESEGKANRDSFINPVSEILRGERQLRPTKLLTELR